MAIDPKKVAAKELTAEEEHEFMNTAPIMDVAAYLGGDLELAVQLRIDDAVSATYDKIAERRGPIAEDLYKKWASELGFGKMDVTVRPIEPQGNLYGFASVTVDDFKIVENKDGELFVGMPSRPDKKSESGYRNTVSIDKDKRDDFNQAVISEYHKAVEKSQERTTKEKIVPAKKPKIADQVAEASKKAYDHNEQLPQQEKTTKTRGARGE
jgi:DNA-binding cell septation regulator SpoVG